MCVHAVTINANDSAHVPRNIGGELEPNEGGWERHDQVHLRVSSNSCAKCTWCGDAWSKWLSKCQRYFSFVASVPSAEMRVSKQTFVSSEGDQHCSKQKKQSCERM